MDIYVYKFDLQMNYTCETVVSWSHKVGSQEVIGKALHGWKYSFSCGVRKSILFLWAERATCYLLGLNTKEVLG